ncbi:hypothetical protein Pfo_022527 [Paulownia fortunei]|nr:hypothetical protein Pfo_022527 [Paulownia fortunei]
MYLANHTLNLAKRIKFLNSSRCVMALQALDHKGPLYYNIVTKKLDPNKLESNEYRSHRLLIIRISPAPQRVAKQTSPSHDVPYSLSEGNNKRFLDCSPHLEVKEEKHNFEEVKIHPIQRPSVLKDGLGNTNPLVLAEADMTTDNQPPPKIRSTAKLTAPKSKRKIARRKGVGRQSRKSTG